MIRACYRRVENARDINRPVRTIVDAPPVRVTTLAVPGRWLKWHTNSGSNPPRAETGLCRNLDS